MLINKTLSGPTPGHVKGVFNQTIAAIHNNMPEWDVLGKKIIWKKLWLSDLNLKPVTLCDEITLLVYMLQYLTVHYQRYTRAFSNKIYVVEAAWRLFHVAEASHLPCGEVFDPFHLVIAD